jgi:uncharacterized protein (DUF1810 family)
MEEEQDRLELGRFVVAQESVFATVLAELEAGQKESHWMWFIFPQAEGLGSSATARHFAIKSTAEARAYLKHPLLGSRLLQCCRALLSVRDKSASQIMGYPDDLKLNSSMTLFSQIAPEQAEFADVLRRYFHGGTDPRTIEWLAEGN